MLIDFKQIHRVQCKLFEGKEVLLVLMILSDTECSYVDLTSLPELRGTCG